MTDKPRFVEMNPEVRVELIRLLAPLVARCSTLGVPDEYWGEGTFKFVGEPSQVLAALVEGRENELSEEARAFMLRMIYEDEVVE